MARSKGKQAKENALAERRAERPFLESALDAFRQNGFSPADSFEIISYVQDNAHPIPETLKERYEGLADDEYDRVMLAAKDITKGYEAYARQSSADAKLENDLPKIFNDRHFGASAVMESHLQKTNSLSPGPDAKQADGEVEEKSGKPTLTQVAALSAGAAGVAAAGHTAIKKWSERKDAASNKGEQKTKEESSSRKAAVFAVVGVVLLGGVGLLANHALAGKVSLKSAPASQGR
ncbi:MAG: hypothetical protein FJX23_04730 [Alphaproteobacteria bacterium]|nr:hypothetical protein [Alphaproteobacteria bacterium]